MTLSRSLVEFKSTRTNVRGSVNSGTGSHSFSRDEGSLDAGQIVRFHTDSTANFLFSILLSIPWLSVRFCSRSAGNRRTAPRNRNEEESSNPTQFSWWKTRATFRKKFIFQRSSRTNSNDRISSRKLHRPIYRRKISRQKESSKGVMYLERNQTWRDVPENFSLMGQASWTYASEKGKHHRGKVYRAK